jgi:hypothetical protein
MSGHSVPRALRLPGEVFGKFDGADEADRGSNSGKPISSVLHPVSSNTIARATANGGIAG